MDSVFGLEIIEEIGSATKMCLNNAGFKSIKDLVIRGPIEIANATGIDMEKCSMLCNKARKILEDLGVYYITWNIFPYQFQLHLQFLFNSNN